MERPQIIKELSEHIENLLSEVDIFKKDLDKQLRAKILSAVSVMLAAGMGTEFEEVKGNLKAKVGIDLINRKGKVGAAVIMDFDPGTVRKIIKKFWESPYIKSIDRIVIFVLNKKGEFSQKSFPEKKIEGNHPVFFDVVKDILDTQMIHDVLRTKPDRKIKEVLDYLSELFPHRFIGSGFSYEQLEHFRQLYLERYVTTISKVNFLGLALANIPGAVDLNELYIRPHYQDLRKKNTDDGTSDYEEVRKPMYEAFGSSRHIALLGNAGAGKSLISKFVVKGLVAGSREFKGSGIENHQPFRIELRKYFKYRQGRTKESFIAFISQYLENYSVHISKDHLFQIFDNLETIVFYDGLDEIFDGLDRQKILFEIENFSTKFPLSKAVITSRPESYNESRSDAIYFKRHELLNFNQAQMEEYVKKWFALQNQGPAKYIADFLQKIKLIDEELKFNPLLLSLILLVYENNGEEIPTTRFEIFKACTETLVTYRDEKQKEISMQSKLQGLKVKPDFLFSSLAYWQFQKLRQKEVIGKKAVHDFLAELFTTHSSGIAIEGLIKDFLDYAKLRSIYVDNQFTHQTFLEYFTANHIHLCYKKKLNDKSYLKDFLIRYGHEPSWRIILELLMSSLEFDGDLNLEIIIDELTEEKEMGCVIFFLSIAGSLISVDSGLLSRLTEQCLGAALDGSETAFDELLEIKRSPSLWPLLEEALIDHFSKPPSEQSSTFLQEFSIVSSDPQLNKLLPLDLELSDYQFILKNYEKFSDRAKYKKFLSILAVNPKYEHLLTKTFTSRYNKSIFFDRLYLNLITSFLFTTDINDWENNYEDLLTLGISDPMIEDSLKGIVFLEADYADRIKERVNTIRSPDFVNTLNALLFKLTDH